jgi:hypothetical protein
MWISVKDRLPEYLQIVDIYSPYDGRVTDVKFIGYEGNEEWVSQNEEWVSQYVRWRGFVTHWMPLPEPPKEG